MTTSSCPNCGKPLRPGSRFCGSCGANLPAQPARAAAPEAGQAAPEAGQPAPVEATFGPPCPNCGRPRRTAARFCSSCGFDMGSADAPTVHVEGVTAPAPQASPMPPSPSTPTPGPTTTPSRPVSAKPPAAPQARPPASGRGMRSFLPLIVGAGLVLCLLAAAGGGFYVIDPFGWFSAVTFSSATPTATEVQAQQPVPAETLMSTQAAELPTATALPPILPTATLEPTAMPVYPTPTQPISTSVPAESTAAPALTTLVEDDFAGELNLNWLAWGNPRPLIDRGPTDSWLYLKAVEDPLSAGVISKFEVPARPGVEVRFYASLDKTYPEAPLFFDWAPVGTEPGPQNPVNGVIHVEVRKDNLVVKTPPTRSNCRALVEGLVVHAYQLRFVEGGGLEFFVDDSPEPFCQISDIGVRPGIGKITFTGTGWVTYVKVSVP
jgi:hypothetical protein